MAATEYLLARGRAQITLSKLFTVVLILSSVGLGGCSQTSSESRPFFRHEYGLDSHGRKTWFDHVVELDPGQMNTKIAPDYEAVAPQTIAVLPFTDRGSANYVVDKIPLTYRNANERADWAWTDANRMHRTVTGYLATREFIEGNLIQIDAHDLCAAELSTRTRRPGRLVRGVGEAKRRTSTASGAITGCRYRKRAISKTSMDSC